MKESNEMPFLGCDEIEQLLIKKDIEGLSEEDSQIIQKHLSSCDRCRSFENTLLSLKDSMKFGRREELSPDPAIRENVIQRMRDLKHQEVGIPGKIYQVIRSLLQYRIPVYQTISVVALIVFIFLAVEYFPFKVMKEPEDTGSIDIIENPAPAQLRVTENLSIVNQQKIGQSVKDDTTITRFITGTI